MIVNRLRFGIICNDSSLFRWQENSLKALLDEQSAMFVLTILIEKESADRAFDRRNRIFTGNFFWNLISGNSGTRNKRLGLDSTDNLGIRQPVIKVKVLPSDDKQLLYSIDNDDIDRINTYSTDFLLNFSDFNFTGKIRGIIRYGIWAYRFGGLKTDTTWPGCFYEVFYRFAVTPVYLISLTGNPDKCIELKSGFFKTNYSYKKTCEQIRSAITVWPVRALNDIISGNYPGEKEQIIEFNPVKADLPNAGVMLKYLFQVLYGNVERKLRLLFYTDFWNIGVAKVPISEFLTGNQPVVEWLPLQNRKKFFADPFALRDESDKQKYHIFCETYSFRKAKGILEHLTWEPGFGREVSPVMEDSLHLSYPYIFEEDGHRYMIPEHYQSGGVSIYEATDFPLKWEKRDTLIRDFAGIDSTLVKWNDLYWLFSSNRKDGYTFKINLFYAETIMGPWIAHPQNPVKTDVRSSRSAGTPFVFEGKLYRPAMDYSGKLQGKIVINRVDKLNKTEFEEVAVKDVMPYTQSAYPHKIHTLSAMGDYTLVDGSREVCILTDPGLLMYNLKLLWGKLLKLN